MNWTRPTGLVVLALVVSLSVFPAGAVSAPGTLGLQTDVDPDRVHMNVHVQENGTATWEIEYLIQLETENDTEAFESLQADVRNNSSAYLDRFATRMNATVADASETTGRSMSTSQFDVTTEIPPGHQYGVLTYSFQWEGFAAVETGTLRIGDALSGLFLNEDTTLRFTWEEGHAVESVEPEPTTQRDRTIIWRGPLDFASGEPSLILEPTAGPTTTTEVGETTTQSVQSPDESGSMMLWGLGGLIFLVLLGVGYWYMQREEEETEASEPDEGASAVPADDLLSNEERVVNYLESVGGRAKQQELVEDLDWTEAKTSQVLSDMEAGDEIEKFRIGRENVVRLPDVDNESNN